MKKLFFVPICIFLIISCKKDPVADFSFSSPSEVGVSIQFTNSSTNSDSYNWNFGDGATSTEESPSHIYEKPGDYNVTLEAKGEGGSSTKNKTISITGITYSFKNNSTGTLYEFSTYYWNGEDIEDWTEHGNLANGATTDIVITERTQIDFAFFSSAEQTQICINTDPYPLTVNQHNELIIDDNTTIFCAEVGGKSLPLNNSEDNGNLADRINAIRSLMPVSTNKPMP